MAGVDRPENGLAGNWRAGPGPRILCGPDLMGFVLHRSEDSRAVSTLEKGRKLALGLGPRCLGAFHFYALALFELRGLAEMDRYGTVDHPGGVRPPARGPVAAGSHGP